MVRVKESPFWKYVDQLPDGSWKCKYCHSIKKGRPNRIIAHLAKVERMGIKTCSGAVPDDVKAEATKALIKGAPHMQQQIEETATNMNPNVHPADEHVSEEAWPVGASEDLWFSTDLAMLLAQSRQPDPLANSSSSQQNDDNTIISIPQDDLWQNIDERGNRKEFAFLI